MLLVVDGSNVGRVKRRQLDLDHLRDAARQLEELHGGSKVVVVIDRSELFTSKVDEATKRAIRIGEQQGEWLVPPVNVEGSDDRFILTIAAQRDGRVVSNDTYRDHVAAFPWLTEPNRLIGADYHDTVGWIFAPRLLGKSALRRAQEAEARARAQAAEIDEQQRVEREAKAAAEREAKAAVEREAKAAAEREAKAAAEREAKAAAEREAGVRLRRLREAEVKAEREAEIPTSARPPEEREERRGGAQRVLTEEQLREAAAATVRRDRRRADAAQAGIRRSRPFGWTSGYEPREYDSRLEIPALLAGILGGMALGVLFFWLALTTVTTVLHGERYVAAVTGALACLGSAAGLLKVPSETEVGMNFVIGLMLGCGIMALGPLFALDAI